MKEIEEGINKQKHTPCSWIGKINIIKIPIIPKGIYTFKEILTKIAMTKSI